MKICPACQLKYTDEDVRCLVDNTVLEKLADERIGTLLAGRYHIEKPLGEGGMAVVYRARNALVDRPVAVKIMNPQLSRDKSLKERFRREAKNAAAVAHPNIIEIHDHGETDDGTPYLVMELLEGMPLDRMIAQGPLPIAQVCGLGLQIARGLARAHDFQVIHRDLKPENIFISKQGGRLVPKLLDFGIARSMHDSRLTSAGQIFGTPQYMAPERVMTIDAGPAADLYALGCILFEMVTGKLPFQANDIPAFIIMHMQQPPPRPSSMVPNVPPALEALILKLLEKKPENRPVDAHSVEKELTALAPPEVLAELPSETQTAAPRTAAATLPPTTLERWAHRAVLFEEMLRRAFVGREPPPELVGSLDQIRNMLRRLTELRSFGLKDQRALEQMEASAREGRQRLGHAMSVLAADLSLARERARSAQTEVQPYLAAGEQLQHAFRAAHRRHAQSGLLADAVALSAAVAAAYRELAELADRYAQASVTEGQARQYLAGKQQEVTDLEFQTQAIRGQLERLEGQYESDRKVLEERLKTSGREIGELEKRLMELATSFLTPLRERRELSDLMTRLDAEGGTAS